MSVRSTPSVPTIKGKDEGPQRYLLWAGIIAPILFATVFTIDGALTPGYSAYNEAISYLDLGTYGWIQRANFIIFGVLLIAFTVGYLKYMRPILAGRWLYTVASLFVLSDLGWIMAGLFVPNPYLAPQNSGYALLHQVASIIVFLPFAIALLVQGIKLLMTRGWYWRIYGGYCFLLGLIQAVFPIGTTCTGYFAHPFGNLQLRLPCLPIFFLHELDGGRNSEVLLTLQRNNLNNLSPPREQNP
jgi:hypothetical membrane protein